jgi:ubiquinone/menaquinone biosynthesis C-methylase UbiE
MASARRPATAASIGRTESPVSAPGLYRRLFLPRLIDLAMKNKATGECRARVIPRAAGRVLEVGIGSGLNLPFYGSRVTEVYGIDPSPQLLKMAARRVDGLGFAVHLLRESAETLSLPAASMDTVVVTWALCSIPDAPRALREMRRVLTPGGTLIFAEHGLSPDRKVQIWQRRLNPLWRCIAGGCNIDRKVDELLVSTGFRIAQLQNSYLPGPRILTYMFEGFAVSARADDAGRDNADGRAPAGRVGGDAHEARAHPRRTRAGADDARRARGHGYGPSADARGCARGAR